MEDVAQTGPGPETFPSSLLVSLFPPTLALRNSNCYVSPSHQSCRVASSQLTGQLRNQPLLACQKRYCSCSPDDSESTWDISEIWSTDIKEEICQLFCLYAASRMQRACFWCCSVRQTDFPTVKKWHVGRQVTCLQNWLMTCYSKCGPESAVVATTRDDGKKGSQLSPEPPKSESVGLRHWMFPS